MSGQTLLFADDSVTMRAIMEKTFQGEPFDVVTVPSGQAAIEQAQSLHPAIVIVDAGMTGVSGYDVCQAIRQDSNINQTPVVLMSGISDPYDESLGTKVGVTEHIKKPFDTTKLIERVTELARTAPATDTAQPGLPPTPPMQAPSGAGIPVSPKAPVKPERPSINKTLHAFPKPSPNGPSPEPTPIMPVAKTDPEPIELDDGREPDGNIQVGTLAELAQMNEAGGQVASEHRPDAIDLEPPASTPLPPSQPASPVESAVVQAAAEVAASVDGLSPQQAQALTTLTEEVIERVVWEVVPDLAEAIIREKIEELTEA